MWLLNAAIFFVLFAFALNNQDSVTLKLFFGHSWEAPMVLVLLLVLLMGVFLGVIVMLPLWLRARRHRQRGSNTTLFGSDTTLMPPDPTDRRHGL
jgi:putative membrane protein